MLRNLYSIVMRWSRKRYATWFLFLLSFLEAFILPVSPILLQLPMTLSRMKQAFRFAAIMTVGSALGAIVGYLIGDFFIGFLEPHIEASRYAHEYSHLIDWISKWGIFVLFPLALSPFPFKITTISAGAVGIPFIPLVILLSFFNVFCLKEANYKERLAG